MVVTNYHTIKGFGESEFEIEKSKFIAYADRVTTEAAARQFIDHIKKKHWSATHNCSAYTLGAKDQQQKADDDGEPSGTAGRPILEVIKKMTLKDTIIVVTRYFGGIKLGAGGLIRAYGKAASNVLSAAGIVECVLHTRMAVCLDYALQGIIENSLRHEGYKIEHKQFTEKVTLTVLVKAGSEEVFNQKIYDMTAAQAKITMVGETYVENIV